MLLFEPISGSHLRSQFESGDMELDDYLHGSIETLIQDQIVVASPVEVASGLILAFFGVVAVRSGSLAGVIAVDKANQGIGVGHAAFCNLIENNAPCFTPITAATIDYTGAPPVYKQWSGHSVESFMDFVGDPNHLNFELEYGVQPVMKLDPLNTSPPVQRLCVGSNQTKLVMHPVIKRHSNPRVLSHLEWA
jgi:hypothetical protein